MVLKPHKQSLLLNRIAKGALAIGLAIGTLAPMQSFAAVRAANNSIVVLDGSLSIDTDRFNKANTYFASGTSAPENVDKLSSGSFSDATIPFSQYGFRSGEVDRYPLLSDWKSDQTVKWGPGDREHLQYIIGSGQWDASSFKSICGSATMYAIVCEYDSDEKKIKKDDYEGISFDYSARLNNINVNANSKETIIANNKFHDPGVSFENDVYEYDVQASQRVFPESYEAVTYATETDIAQMCPWYKNYYNETKKRWGNMSSTNAYAMWNQYQGSKYVSKEAVNKIWAELSGNDGFKFLNYDITTASSSSFRVHAIKDYGNYNWNVSGTLYDYYETEIPVGVSKGYHQEKDPKYKDWYAEINYSNTLTTDWQISGDEKTWYTIVTGTQAKSFTFNMLTHNLSIGGTTVKMPDELKNETTWYVRRISTASGIYGTAISPSMAIRPFISLQGIDIYSKVDVVEGNYLDPKDIVLNVHYSSFDRVMAGNGSYISYPGNSNLRITIVGDNWVYYVFTDPITKSVLRGFFKVKGIEKSPVSATAEYVGGTVVEKTNYKPEYLHVNVTFNNGTIDTFTANSSNVGTYKYKSYGKGDMDGNGVLNQTDVTLLESIIKGSTATDTQKKQADVNSDGKINEDDLTTLKSYVSKKVDIVGNNTFYAAFAKLTLSDGSPKYARFNVQGVKKKPYSLTIVSDPIKTRYIEGEDFKPSGLTLKVLYDNGENQYISYGDQDTLTSKEGVTFGDDETSATHMKADTVYLPITYEENGTEVTTDLKLKVNLVQLTSIRVTRAPDTTVYYAGESFKTTGMDVTAYFDEDVEDHIPDEVLLTASEYILSNYKSLKDSTEYIVLKLDDPSKVHDVMGEYLRVSKIKFSDGQDFSDGTSGTFTYKDGSTVKGTVCGNHLIKISYTYRGVTKVTYQPIYAMAKKPTGLTIVSMPYKVDYTAGETFQQDGLILRVAYSDGSSNYLYSKNDTRNGYTIANGSSLTVGQNYVVAEYVENGVTLQVDVPITVIDPSIDGITATYLGPSIYVGQNFNKKDVQIVISYTNGDIKSFRANEPGQDIRFVKPNADDGSVNINGTSSQTVTESGDNIFAAVYSGKYDTFNVPGVGKPDQLDFSGSTAKSKRMYDTWTEKFTAIKIRSVADYINGRVESSIADHEVNKQKTTDTRQYLTSEEGTAQGVVAGTGTSNALLSFLREGSWRQPETVISLKYKGRTNGFLYPETNNPKFTMNNESDLKYITAHEQYYNTIREELQGYMEEGWSDWVTNGDSVGTVSADRVAYRYTGPGGNASSETMLINDLKIKLDNVTGSSNPRLNVSIKNTAGIQTDYNGITENDTITDPSQIKINLAGTVQVIDTYGNEVTKNFGDVYKVYYRTSTDDSVKWTKGGGKTLEDGSIEDGEWAGFDGVQMQCLEIKLMLIDTSFDVGSMTEAPVINVQPKNISTRIGNNATLAVSAIGNDLYYQWYCNGVAIPDGTTAVYATPPLTLADNGNVYYCMIIANNGTGMSVKSDSITLTVRDQSPVFTTDLEETLACNVGDEVTMNITATCLNPSDLTYEWQITQNGTYVPLAGGTENSITFTVTPDMHGQYIRCRVTNSNGTCNSNPCQINCVGAPIVTVKSSETSHYVALSKTNIITFSADVISYASGEKTYTWVIDGITQGTTTDTITWIPNTNGTHNISCTVKDSLGKTGTGSYNIYVGQKPTVTLTATKEQQSDKTWNVYVVATVSSSDIAGLTYTWSVDGVPVTVNTNSIEISADKKTLTLKGLKTGSQKSVSLEISDHYGSVSSLAGAVTQ